MTTAFTEPAVRITNLGGWVAADLARLETRIAVRIEDFGSWMTVEQKRIYLLCLRLLRNGEDADSATQDTFFKAYQALRRQGSGAIEFPEKWLTRIAVNTCLDILRSRRWMFWQRKVCRSDEQTMCYLIPAPGPTPESALFARDIGRRISAALDKLSLRQRSVFILRHEEDRSLEEIAEVLELDIGTVKAHMFRALKKLREELRDLYGKQTLE